MQEEKDRISWFKEARFGIFVHYGLYSILARGEWAMYVEKIPFQDYKLLATKFLPQKGFITQWVKLAKECGAKYIVLTTRHHDGFSLFDSKISDFNSFRYSKIDVVREFVKACRKYDIKIGLYYSLSDWHIPAYFKGPKRDPKGWKTYIKYLFTQVEEILTKYGRIDILWYDGEWPIPYTPEEWNTQKLSTMARKLQPHIIINDRWGIPKSGSRRKGDFDTCEQNILQSERIWECAMTMNDHWGYCRNDKNWKTTRQLIHNLVKCASWGGNYLLNIGPKKNGSIPSPSIKRLKEIGLWLRNYGDSIYGTSSTHYKGEWWSFKTRKWNYVYIHIFHWTGSKLYIGEFKEDVNSAFLTSSKEKLKVQRDKNGRLIIGLPQRAPDSYDTVITLKTTGGSYR